MSLKESSPLTFVTSLCQVEVSKMNREHVLLCSRLGDTTLKSSKSVVQLYWDVRELMNWNSSYCNNIKKGHK